MKKALLWIIVPMICYATAGAIVGSYWKGLLVVLLVFVGIACQDMGFALPWRRMVRISPETRLPLKGTTGYILVGDLPDDVTVTRRAG